MQCPQCHEENPDQAKFCLNCGTKLSTVCPQCGTVLPPQARFCFGCGAALAPPTPPPLAPSEPTPAPAVDTATLAATLRRLVPKEYVDRLLATRGQATSERRMVTILFSDVKGSTAMASDLDPEDVLEIMEGALEVLIAPIYRYEGTLARLMGDAILAFFGAPIAHENDPERACRAALEIVSGAQQYAARLEKERGIRGFNVRVGINTGLVVVGEIGADLRVEYTAMGDAINLAARMEQNAPPGGILITHNTYQQVRGLFEVQALEPLTVKGKAEPVQAYLVQRARPRAFRLATRGIEGIETRMVGREGEMKRLQDAFYLALEDRERQMVTITGEAGVGKSRLLYEFEAWLENLPQPIRYFRGRASPELQGVPYSLLRDLFLFHFDIQESDPAETVREKLERGIGEVLGADPPGRMKSHLIGQLLGFDFSDSPDVQAVRNDARQLRDRAMIYLGEFFRATTTSACTVIMLEDIHWADDSSLDAVIQLAVALPDLPLLIVALARPAFLDRRPHWGESYTFHTHLNLLPLSKRDSRVLIEEILQKVDQVPTTLHDLILSKAEGNPLYVEELIKMLIEEGTIVKGADRWCVVTERLTDLRVPPTLTGLLQARLDSLPLNQRTVLQQAAVVGRTFWDRVVVRLGRAGGEEVDEEEIPLVLSALRSREMVAQRETSAFAGAQEFIFKHAALREVAYDSILKKTRRHYHSVVADWLIEQGGDRAGEYTGLIGDHLELAGRTEEACSYLRRAGAQAAARFANAEAVNFFSRVLTWIPQTDTAQRYDLLLAREKVYDLQGNRDGQKQDLATLQELAHILNEDRRRAEVALRLASYHEAVSDFPAAQVAAQEAVGRAQSAGDPLQEIAGWIAWARALWRQGQFAPARQQLEQAWELAQRHGDRPGEASALHYLGTVLFFMGDLPGALAKLEQAVDIRRSLRDRRAEATSLNNLIGIYDSLGDYARGKSCSEQALAIYQTIGDRRGEATALGNLAANYLALGNPQQARDYHLRALALYQTIGDREGEARTANNLGLVFHYLGEDREAQRYCEQALAINRSTGNRSGEGYSLTHLALALEGLGRLDEAAAAFEQALMLRRELGQMARAMDDLAGLSRVTLRQGQVETALQHIGEALAWVEEHGVAGIDYPLHLYMTAAEVWTAAGQPERAAALLRAAHTLIETQAGHISDEATRRAFLENVPVHRQIRERLARQQPPD